MDEIKEIEVDIDGWWGVFHLMFFNVKPLACFKEHHDARLFLEFWTTASGPLVIRLITRKHKNIDFPDQSGLI